MLQQLIHSIDKGAWVLHDQPPVKAWGMGGRSNCFGPGYGVQIKARSPALQTFVVQLVGVKNVCRLSTP